mmetsp:Transcript_10197/g.15613  ORF Transcript_10197/g.15613 Transcript_10197/m.15613 type:complete len:322 (-) Transcript_10197:145-1110(-)
MDSSAYAALLARSSGKQCLVYKCIADAQFDDWIQKAQQEHGHSTINLVGRASSQGDYQGPTMSQAMAKVHNSNNSKLHFGCVCIAERHTLEAAQARNKSYPTEHANMVRKIDAGCEWFVSQAIYDTEPTIRLLKDYAALCRERGIVKPKKVILTFAPVSRQKTINFMKWLGVRIPEEAEQYILQAEKPVDASVDFLCRALQTILKECSGIGVPLGISCESVSIFKSEIDGCHELFRKLQEIMLDARGSPWKVQWVDVVVPRPLEEEKKEEKMNDVVVTKKKQQFFKEESNAAVEDILRGVLLGGALVIVGVFLGMGFSRRR